MRCVLAAAAGCLLVAGCAAPPPTAGNWDLGGGIALTPDGQVVVSGRIQAAPTWMLAPPAHDADPGRHLVMTSATLGR